MEKQRKWQFFLILVVIVLTIYNVLPTLFYYLQPLKDPISPSAAEKIGASIVSRVNNLEKETKDWVGSYCSLIHVKPLYISAEPENPGVVNVAFTSAQEARRLKEFLPRAGSLIPFAPSQLSLGNTEDPKLVQILRNIPIRLESQVFAYFPKNDEGILE